MPRYYFDIREGLRFVRDESGEDFDGFETAERGALRTVAELGRDRLLKGDAGDLTLEMRNETHQRVLSVTAAIKINRIEPSPEPPRAQ
jgi:hypothetical protein